MKNLPSAPVQIQKWLAKPFDPLEQAVGGYGIAAHVIKESCIHGMPQTWIDRRATECVSLLLDAGIRVDVPSPEPGPHPLFEACFRALPKTTCLLLEHGADPLNTRAGLHDDLYVVDQAFQSFKSSGPLKNHEEFLTVMERLLSPVVVNRINEEPDHSIFKHITGYGSTARIKRRVGFCIGKGVRLQEQWEELLKEAEVPMDWAKGEEAKHVQSIMSEKTVQPSPTLPTPTPRF